MPRHVNCSRLCFRTREVFSAPFTFVWRLSPSPLGNLMHLEKEVSVHEDTEAIEDEFGLDEPVHAIEATHMTGQMAQAFGAHQAVTELTFDHVAAAVKPSAVASLQQRLTLDPRRVMRAMPQVLSG